MPRAETLDVATTDQAVAVEGAETETVSIPALVAEICWLGEQGLSLQVQASRLARESRAEHEAWCEAGLILRRASERLASANGGKTNWVEAGSICAHASV